ncbi:sulfotransferase family protein [Salinibacter grassmerensis]|uniref:sulfotransferase family protein n=1 Tax=Salinibacter grassmerensis TaxID=3040353 RepID=UPI0021E83A7A|nr:sulfotransferase [Salinibacter grassmerensis]
MEGSNGPIFIIGRPHSGNTMLTDMLGRHPDIRSYRGEDHFFEKYNSIKKIENNEKKFDRIIEEVIGGMDSEASERRGSNIYTEFNSEGIKSKSIHEVYEEGKRYFAKKENSKRWAQKATSYIFYVDDIIDRLPSSKFIFVVRNPMDIAASKKRRGDEEKWFRTLWGWSRGVRKAYNVGDKLDKKILIVKYEDIVKKPNRELKKVSSFLDIDYTDSFLDIPHVNRSETPYNKKSDERGLNSDRVFYFVNELTTEEAASVRWLVDEELLQKVYPDLSGGKDVGTIETLTKVLSITFTGITHLFKDQGSLFLTEPQRALSRLRLRLFGNNQNSD